MFSTHLAQFQPKHPSLGLQTPRECSLATATPTTTIITNITITILILLLTLLGNSSSSDLLLSLNDCGKSTQAMLTLTSKSDPNLLFLLTRGTDPACVIKRFYSDVSSDSQG